MSVNCSINQYYYYTCFFAYLVFVKTKKGLRQPSLKIASQGASGPSSPGFPMLEKENTLGTRVTSVEQ